MSAVIQGTNKTVRCKQFTDFLIRRSEHLDQDLIADVTPTDGWIGHVEVGEFPSFDGISHTFDRLNDVFPDLSGSWTNLQVGNCLGNPCDPTAQKIGMGYTRDSYTLQQKAYQTQLFCFDLVMSADRAKQQFAHLLTNLRKATNIIVSDRLRQETWKGADKILSSTLVNGKPQETTFTVDDTDTQYTFSVLPTSMLNIEQLMQQVVPLRMAGYLGMAPEMGGIFELVTDIETAWQLREANATLQPLFRFTDFAEGGKLFKFGITDGIGNFAIRTDPHVPRFQLMPDNTTLQRVFPYVNEATTSGIRRVVNEAYVNAQYQISQIVHRRAMRSLVRRAESVNANMPFAVRDYGGAWMFAMDNLGTDERGCVIENARRNKGLFLADFVFATEYMYREWTQPFLHLREQPCAAALYPCGDAPDYVAQDYSSDNTECSDGNDFEFDLGGLLNFTLDALICNGVPVEGVDPGPYGDVADVRAYLVANFGTLGTWTVDGESLVLSDTSCSSFEIEVNPI